MTAVAARYHDLRELDAEVLSISVDSQYVHKIWQEQELTKMIEGGVPYPMLSDPGGRIGKAYGVFDEESGIDCRACFIIDPDGIVQAAEILAPSVGRNSGELLRQVAAFRHARETGELLPSDWEPGKPTLQPGPDLVGKIWTVWKPEKGVQGR